jgi:pimeloyl-ACP methyl ester carboxylesterase
MSARHVASFLHAFLRPEAVRVPERLVHLDLPSGPTPALQIGEMGGAPWVVLHGVTVPGARHPQLQRLVRALASAGARVLVPDIAPWRELRIDRDRSAAVITAAVERAHDDASGQQVTLCGFSIGGTEALTIAALPAVASRLRRVASYGGYADLERAVRFMFTGAHDREEVPYRGDPDPYELEGAAAVADAVRGLALEVGSRQAFAGDPRWDERKAELRATLPAEAHRTWDVLAPPAGTPIPREEGKKLAHELARAALRTEPRLDPRASLGDLSVPVELLHGEGDRLIPFSEAHRLAALLPADRVNTTITPLFTHSSGVRLSGVPRVPRAAIEFARVLGRTLG